MKKFNVFKSIGYCFILMIIILINAIAINFLLTVRYAISDIKSAITQYNSAFDDTSFILKPYSLEYNGYDTPDSLLQAFHTEFGETYLGSTQRMSAMHLDNDISPILFADDFIFDTKYFTLITGTMPNLSKTTATYIEALLCESSEYATTTAVGKEYEITFSQPTAVRKVKIKIVGVAALNPGRPLHDTINGRVTFAPDISQLLGLELMPNRGKDITLTFKTAAAKNLAIHAAAKYGVVTDLTNQFVKMQEKRLKNYQTDWDLLLPFAIVTIITTAALLYFITFPTFKKIGNSMQGKASRLLLFICPVFSAIMFFVLNLMLDFSVLLFGIRFLSMSILLACFMCVAVSLLGIFLSVFLANKQKET